MKAMPLLLILAFAAPQVRDVARPEPGTAVLSGTVVTDEPDSQPVRRAVVIVHMGDLRRQRQTSTDDRGRFAFAGLPAGNATLIAGKPAYVTTYYGARRPGATIGVPIALTAGEQVNVTIRLPRGGVITGTVFDEDGRPVPSTSVRIHQMVVSPAGERSLVNYSNGALVPSTDDRGMYRVYGLPAGSYAVSVQPRYGGVIGGGDLRQSTAAELQWAERVVQAGRSGSSGAPATGTTPPAPSQTVTYATVFYPGVVVAANAGVVALAGGQERSGIDLRMQFIPTARVEGAVATSDGQPASGIQVSLLPKSDMAGSDAGRQAALMEVGLASGLSARTGQDGAFSLRGVEPGAYTVLARTGPAGRAGGPAPTPGTLWALQDIDVAGRDITGLAMRLAPGQSVSGRFVFEGKAPVTPAQVTISLRAVTSAGVSASAPIALAAVDDPFSVPGMVPSSYRVSATVGAWMLKSAMLGGRDVSDVPLEIKPGEDVSGLVLTFTDSPASVTGVLYDGANRPTSDLSIVLFAADRSMWSPGSRRVRPPVRPASDGRFTFSGLAPGDYYLAALTEVSATDLASPLFLEQVVPAAIKITVAAGEKKTQDVKLAKSPAL